MDTSLVWSSTGSPVNNPLGIRVWRCATPECPLLGGERQSRLRTWEKAAEMAVLCAAPSARRRAQV